MVHEEHKAASVLSRSRIIMILFLLFIAYFLWTEHRAHTLQYLPYAILLLCPFMHLFMHHGHGDHGGSTKHEDQGHTTTAHETHSDGGWRTMNHDMPAYGLWSLVLINSVIFIVFAFSFTKPKTPRDWRSFSAFSAFIVALFAEMYGFPLTIYLISGWLQSRYPNLDPFSHDSGHLWHTVLGLKSNAHLNPIHLLANGLIFGGFILLSSAWRVLYAAQKSGALARTGPYARVRHPQYDAFVLIMLGFLLMWPTLLTLLMFPVLVFMYIGLAKREEREVREGLGEVYDRYAARTPSFFPRFGSSDPSSADGRTIEKKGAS